jgi:secondary thiamine-phosphate synthase enzyme
METFAPAPACRHIELQICTDRPTVFVDLTDQVEEAVAASGVDAGLVNIQTLHTTTAIVVNEHEPLLLSDFVALIERTAPLPFSYHHDDARLRTVNVTPGERPNGHAHCRALLLCPSVSLNVARGRLQLGRWQRIFLAELDGPRTREVSVLVMGWGASADCAR